ncbi:MAG: hypothetical protein AAF609_05385 [Cyanobacteria bacterium P01_C01_bin.120]
MTTALKPIEILSLGPKISHNAGRLEVSEQILQDLVDTFEPLPFVAGHPQPDQEDEFELAQAQAVELKDGKVSVVEYGEVPPATRAAVNSGELNKVSVKMRPPGHPENHTGKWKLLHIGMFGRNPVADTAIADAAFSAEYTEDVCLSAFPKSETTGNGGAVQADPALQPDSDHPTQEDPMGDTPKDTPAVDTELAADRQKLEQDKADFELRQAQFARREAITPVLNGLVADRKLLPGEVQPFAEVFSRLPDNLDFEFAQGDETVKTSVSDFLKGFLKTLPQRGPDLGELPPATDAKLQAPNNTTADPAAERRKAAAAGLEKWGQ